MRSPDQAPTPEPEPEPYRPDPSFDERVRSELAELTERVAAEERAIAQAQARRLERLLELQEWSELPRVASRLHGNPQSIRDADVNAATLTDEQARAAAYSRWDDHEVARRTIVTETACLLNVAERTVGRLMDEARFLYSYAPATFDALARGEISYRHATTLLDQLLTLPVDHQAAFEQAVLPLAKTHPVGRFRDRARRLRERRHPESILTRSRTALTDRRTYWEPAADGMAWLHWYGTAEQTKAACDRITAVATALQKLDLDQPAVPAGSGVAFGCSRDIPDPPADPAPTRTLAQLRADVTADLLVDGVTPSGLGAGIRASVMVTVPVFTLLGLDEEPATLEGYGPISPETARQIAGQASSFLRILTHPETGAMLSVGKDPYLVTSAMRRALHVRDETCRFPGCSRPAVRADIDHTQDWQYGGATEIDNLACLCEAHHRLKHIARWQVTQHPGGILTWTSPGGRSYTTNPANPIGVPRPRPPGLIPGKRCRSAPERYSTSTSQPKRRPHEPAPENPPF